MGGDVERESERMRRARGARDNRGRQGLRQSVVGG